MSSKLVLCWLWLGKYCLKISAQHKDTVSANWTFLKPKTRLGVHYCQPWKSLSVALGECLPSPCLCWSLTLFSLSFSSCFLRGVLVSGGGIIQPSKVASCRKCLHLQRAGLTPELQAALYHCVAACLHPRVYICVCVCVTDSQPSQLPSRSHFKLSVCVL